jgi:hypothetical protein
MQFYSTNDLPADLAELSFAANIARIMPNGEAPLFAMSGLAKTKTALQIEHGYWSKTMVFGKVTLGAAVASAGATTFTVVSTATVTVNDLLMVENAFSGSTFVPPEKVRITAVVNATTLTVERGFAGTTAKTSIADTTVIPVIGNAYSEGSPKPASKSIAPVRHLNYTHIFRNAWSQSKTLAAVRQIVGNGTVAENKMDCTNFHSRDIELATFFSRKSNSIDPVTNQPIHTMDGLEAIVHGYAPGNIKTAGATTSYSQFIDMLDQSFDQRTSTMSANTRIGYAGKTAIKVINEIGRLSGQYQVVQKQTSFGLKFTEVVMPRGTLQLVEHPIFSTHVTWQKLLVVAELSSFDFAYLEGRNTEVTYINEMDKATDGTDATGGVLTTELTIELQNPFAWMFIYGLTQGVA